MTPDERLESLLNRCGCTISDLPNRYSIDAESDALEAAADSGFSIDAYACHLADIIDRMETAIINLLVDRDGTQGVDERDARLLGELKNASVVLSANYQNNWIVDLIDQVIERMEENHE